MRIGTARGTDSSIGEGSIDGILGFQRFRGSANSPRIVRYSLSKKLDAQDGLGPAVQSVVYPRPYNVGKPNRDYKRIAIFMTLYDMAANNMLAIRMPAIRALSPLAHAGHGPIDASHPAHFLTAPRALRGYPCNPRLVACLVWLAARRAYRISKPT